LISNANVTTSSNTVTVNSSPCSSCGQYVCTCMGSLATSLGGLLKSSYTVPSFSSGGITYSSGIYTSPSPFAQFTDEQILDEVKRRKLIHDEIVDGFAKNRKISKLEKEIAEKQKELESIKKTDHG
jgi:hypothetical protein